MASAILSPNVALHILKECEGTCSSTSTKITRRAVAAAVPANLGDDAVNQSPVRIRASVTSEHQSFVVLRGLSQVVVACRCVARKLFLALVWPWKFKKEKGSGSNPCEKLYLEGAFLQRLMDETDLIRLVKVPPGIDGNEWIASQIVDLVDHVNHICAVISEFCTPAVCADMRGPCSRVYQWVDDRGRKSKVSASQYMDFAMTFIQSRIDDESLFPSKTADAFPEDLFLEMVKRICQMLFHILAHVYYAHFKELVLLDLHSYVNTTFLHLIVFNDVFQLMEHKETEVLQDLRVAMNRSSVYASARCRQGHVRTSRTHLGCGMHKSSSLPERLDDIDGMHCEKVAFRGMLAF